MLNLHLVNIKKCIHLYQQQKRVNILKRYRIYLDRGIPSDYC
jgi:hypothetical protein